MKYRCDKPMRKSKERCYVRSGVHWTCTGECNTCICCIKMDEYGNESHVGAKKWMPKDIWTVTD